MMDRAQEIKLTYLVAMSTCLSGFAGQAIVRWGGYPEVADGVLALSVLYTIAVHRVALRAFSRLGNCGVCGL